MSNAETDTIQGNGRGSDSSATAAGDGKAKRGKGLRKPRIMRDYPAATFEDSLPLATAIHQHASGKAVRRLTLLEQLDKSPDSSTTRMLITNSSKYGLTKGSYAAEFLELTELGRDATSPEVSAPDMLAARFKLTIENQKPFRLLYKEYQDNKLPSRAVMRDFLKSQKYSEDAAVECVDLFVSNAKFLGLLKTIAGAERLVKVEQVLEQLPKEPSPGVKPQVTAPVGPEAGSGAGLDDVCFYITPIGDPDSEFRMHSDLFLSSIVEPALEEFGLRVVRADQIGSSGMITSQIIEYVLKAKLVIADLSYHNPNVFYELCLRHVTQLPTVHIIRQSDNIPFDLNQVRTIVIDNSTIYSLVPSLETYRSEIANQVRRALKGEPGDNPLSVFRPKLREELAR